MARYIDTAIIAKIVFDRWKECEKIERIIPDIKRAIMYESADDVVEVVRCKDCLYWKTETEPIGIECEPGEDAHYCAMDGMITRTADFCSYGDHK